MSRSSETPRAAASRAAERAEQASVKQELPADRAARTQRADAQRNRAKLLQAAAKAFAERDVDASLEDIARAAGVGIGTLYRHFPTRFDLIEAVYRNEVEQLCAAADGMLERLPADVALATWMEDFVRYVAFKRGLVGAMKSVVTSDSEIFAYTHRLVRETMSRLVDAAAAAGTICPNTDPEDLLRALGGFCSVSSEQPGWQERALRLVALMMDGLRFRAPATTG